MLDNLGRALICLLMTGCVSGPPSSLSPVSESQLEKAIDLNDIPAVSRWMRAGGNVNGLLGSFKNITPLDAAAASGRAEIVHLLIRKGAHVNPGPRQNPAMVNSPLGFACGAGDFETVRVLIDAGADVNYTTRDGWRPLHMAAIASIGNFEGNISAAEARVNQKIDADRPRIVSYLMNHGADPNARTDDGKTARDLAVERKHLDIVKILDASTKRLRGDQ